MNSKNQNTSLFQKEQVIDSLKQSFVKLNPNIMIKNPIMFTVEVSTVNLMLFRYWIFCIQHITRFICLQPVGIYNTFPDLIIR